MKAETLDTLDTRAPVEHAMILAAGRGDRMRPLSDVTPKPLLAVNGKPLIVWHLEALAAAGIRYITVNTAWLEESICQTLGDGLRWGVQIRYSLEGRDHGGALETAGGIATARPWLEGGGGVQPGGSFWLVSADIYCPGFGYDAAAARAFAEGSDLAHLWMVPNPPYHPAGDFVLSDSGRVTRAAESLNQRLGDRMTYANVALCRSALTEAIEPGTRAPLGPLLFAAADRGLVGGTRLLGRWENVGTPDQLAELNASLAR